MLALAAAACDVLSASVRRQCLSAHSRARSNGDGLTLDEPGWVRECREPYRTAKVQPKSATIAARGT